MELSPLWIIPNEGKNKDWVLTRTLEHLKELVLSKGDINLDEEMEDG